MTDSFRDSEMRLEALRRRHREADEAHAELLMALEMREDSVPAALDVVKRLHPIDRVALREIMRAYCHPDRLDPATAEQWLCAYSIISDAVDPASEEARGWSVVQ